MFIVASWKFPKSKNNIKVLIILNSTSLFKQLKRRRFVLRRRFILRIPAKRLVLTTSLTLSCITTEIKTISHVRTTHGRVVIKYLGLADTLNAIGQLTI